LANAALARQSANRSLGMDLIACFYFYFYFPFTLYGHDEALFRACLGERDSIRPSLFFEKKKHKLHSETEKKTPNNGNYLLEN
jgi:hypothetical protein